MIVAPMPSPSPLIARINGFSNAIRPSISPGKPVTPGNEGGVARALRHLEQVGAGAEGPALPREHHDRDRRVVERVGECIRERVVQRLVERVERFGTSEREHADALGVFTSQHSFSVAVATPNRQNAGRSSMPERPLSPLTASTWCTWVLPSSKLSADAAM